MCSGRPQAPDPPEIDSPRYRLPARARAAQGVFPYAWASSTSFRAFSSLRRCGIPVFASEPPVAPTLRLFGIGYT
jgi:hypothetical protein